MFWQKLVQDAKLETRRKALRVLCYVSVRCKTKESIANSCVLAAHQTVMETNYSKNCYCQLLGIHRVSETVSFSSLFPSVSAMANFPQLHFQVLICQTIDQKQDLCVPEVLFCSSYARMDSVHVIEYDGTQVLVLLRLDLNWSVVNSVSVFTLCHVLSPGISTPHREKTRVVCSFSRPINQPFSFK